MIKPYPEVRLTDETLRDGLQIEREDISVDEKLALLGLLLEAGVKRLMVGASVSAKWSPQMAGTSELVARLRPRQGVEFLALALNERGRAMRRGSTPPLAIDGTAGTHLHMCDVFMKRNTNMTFEEQERTWQGPIAQAKAIGAHESTIALSAAWGSNWRGAFSQQARMTSLQRQWDAWNAVGIVVTSVSLLDPMGWNTPSAVGADLIEILQRFPSIHTFHLHLHNARGLAMMSAWEALRILDERHVLMLDASVGGIGGCPYCGNGQATGMLPLEDLVQLLTTLGIDVGVDLGKLIDASVYLSSLLGRPLSSQVARNGPLPSAGSMYSEELPVLYTFKEAQHFRLGPSAVQADRPRPWQWTS